jgi:hypothetical protein
LTPPPLASVEPAAASDPQPGSGPEVPRATKNEQQKQADADQRRILRHESLIASAERRLDDARHSVRIETEKHRLHPSAHTEANLAEAKAKHARRRIERRRLDTERSKENTG